MNSKFVIGVDYGTDSARALLVNAASGEILASSEMLYPQWNNGEFCDQEKRMYRQHPNDYLEVLRNIVPDIISKAPAKTVNNIVAISFDTTGSTPALVGKNGIPLALESAYSNNPNAMFVLWKDYTAIKEAEEINYLAKNNSIDYTLYSGGIYSPEWAWAKMSHILNEDKELANSSYSWIEHCDWMSSLLTGVKRPVDIMRSRCAAGHKAMWNKTWNGLPDEDFLIRLNPGLKGFRNTFDPLTYTSEKSAGTITPEWAKELGLPEHVVVGVGALDAHFGAVGAGIGPKTLVKVIGTSTCDMITVSKEVLNGRIIPGISGQVDGSIIPGLIGLEAGQSAFGDLFAWFKDLLLWPLKTLATDNSISEFDSKILPHLNTMAEAIPAEQSSVLALDWINGRRTPDSDPNLSTSISGITMGTSAPHIYRALVEAAAFGSLAILERYREYNIEIDSVIGVGGIANKSPFVMQTLSEILNTTIKVVSDDRTCAMGAAMFASVAAGVHENVGVAQKYICQGYGPGYIPDPKNVKTYSSKYLEYKKLGSE